MKASYLTEKDIIGNERIRAEGLCHWVSPTDNVDHIIVDKLGLDVAHLSSNEC